MKYKMRSDFADELVGDESNKIFEIKKRKVEEVDIVKVEIKSDDNDIGKKKGKYYTVEFQNIMDQDDRKRVVKALNKCLKDLVKINKSSKFLIVGLGNSEITADALGPLCAQNVMVTNHLIEHKLIQKNQNVSSVAVLTPGVMGQTGLETSDIVKSLVELYLPTCVIVIDALATSNINRINKVIQVSDSGISPGSGVKNHRKAISKEVLGVDVIAIGVASVIEVKSLIFQLFDQLETLMELNPKHAQKMVLKIMEDKNMDMVVTPKEIDEQMKHLSSIIAESINESIHKDFFRM